ncbi:MAG: hypothetical protein ACE5K1_03425 [Acidiferrobacterales bacterium]
MIQINPTMERACQVAAALSLQEKAEVTNPWASEEVPDAPDSWTLQDFEDLLPD